MRSESAYLQDILSACQEVTKFIVDHTFESFNESATEGVPELAEAARSLLPPNGSDGPGSDE
jgi:uncharacterized protein with HEPN domain